MNHRWSWGSVVVWLLTASTVVFADSRQVRDEIFDAIEHERGFGAYELEIEVRQGNVALFGSVASLAAKQRVEEISNSIAGVRSVSNNIRVNENLSLHSGAPSGVSPVELAQRVRERVLADRTLSSFELSVRAEGDQVSLEGTVGNAEDSSRIQKIAESVSGVGKVTNALVVSSRQSGASAVVPDRELRAQILRALQRESGLSVEGLEIEAKNGIVSLSGSRSDHRERDRILSIVLSVPGVRDVRSNLR